MPFLSIILATARPSKGAMKGRELDHILACTIQSLHEQSFKDFELIVVDSLASTRDLESEVRKEGGVDFPFKVVSPTSWWIDRKLWGLQNAFNEGAMAASGEHFMFCGDCCEFPTGSLAKTAEWLGKGFAPHLLVVYKSHRRVALAGPSQTPSDFPGAGEVWSDDLDGWNNEVYSRDSRWRYVKQGVLMPDDCFWQWYYGYCTISREDFFYVNGWDENFDGMKPYGDIDLGSRLNTCGRWKMVLDPGLYLYENAHHTISSPHFHDIGGLGGYPTSSGPFIRCNPSLLWTMRVMGIWRANSSNYTPELLTRCVRGEVMGDFRIPKLELDGTQEFDDERLYWINNPTKRELCP